MKKQKNKKKSLRGISSLVIQCCQHRSRIAQLLNPQYCTQQSSSATVCLLQLKNTTWRHWKKVASLLVATNILEGGGEIPQIDLLFPDNLLKCHILVGILQNKSDMFLAGVCSDSAKIRDTDMSWYDYLLRTHVPVQRSRRKRRVSAHKWRRGVITCLWRNWQLSGSKGDTCERCVCIGDIERREF